MIYSVDPCCRENINTPRAGQFTNTNMFRRAKSSEWDRDVLNNNISDLRSVKKNKSKFISISERKPLILMP